MKILFLLEALIISFAKGQLTGNPNPILPDLIPQCSSIIRDVVFILDGSASISKADFQLGQKFISQIIKFTIEANNQNRIAFIIFGDSADIVFDFKKHNSIEGMIKDVENTKNENGVTAIGKALNLTYIELLPTMKPDVDKLAILLTDGSNNKYPAPYIYADKLKAEGVQIMTIGIGSDIRREELSTIASPGLALKFDSFSGLVDSKNQIISHICPIPDPGLAAPCNITKLDLVIVLDSSSSISDNDYDQAKRFVFQMFNRLELGSEKSRVAMVSFSGDIRIDFNFGEYNDIKSLKGKVKSLTRFGGVTAIGKALKAVQSDIFPRKRTDVPFNILLITDGVNNVYPRPYGIAKSLKEEGANIIALGVGSDIDLNELKSLSSNDKILTVESFDELQSNLKTVQQAVICGSSSEGNVGYAMID